MSRDIEEMTWDTGATRPRRRDVGEHRTDVPRHCRCAVRHRSVLQELRAASEDNDSMLKAATVVSKDVEGHV
jgi:hypothetical protein